MPRDVDGRFIERPEVHVNALDPMLDRLSSAVARIAATRAAVEAGAPWPVGAVAEGGGEGEWGPTEVLAHVSEMLPYWLGEMERVIEGSRLDAGPAAFGRTATDQIRTLTVVRDATLPPRELFDRIGSNAQRYRLRLPLVTETEAAAVGLHPTRGELAVPALIEQLVVSHLEDHADQLEAAIGG
jgi:hypothetical protein